MDTTIPLDTPIKRGETTIGSVELRKPNAGELRGISLINLLQMDVDSLIKVLPRITTPSLTAIEAASLDPADLVQMGAAVSSFLVSKGVMAAAEAMPSSYQIQ